MSETIGIGLTWGASLTQTLALLENAWVDAFPQRRLLVIAKLAVHNISARGGQSRVFRLHSCSEHILIRVRKFFKCESPSVQCPATTDATEIQQCLTPDPSWQRTRNPAGFGSGSVATTDINPTVVEMPPGGLNLINQSTADGYLALEMPPWLCVENSMTRTSLP